MGLFTLTLGFRWSAHGMKHWLKSLTLWFLSATLSPLYLRKPVTSVFLCLIFYTFSSSFLSLRSSIKVLCTYFVATGVAALFIIYFYWRKDWRPRWGRQCPDKGTLRETLRTFHHCCYHVDYTECSHHCPSCLVRLFLLSPCWLHLCWTWRVLHAMFCLHACS